MPLDLSPIKAVAEDLLCDQVRITRDVEGTRNDVFNEETGQYDAPEGDAPIVIYEGKALIWAVSRMMQEEQIGGQSTHITPYGMLLPITVKDLKPYDRVIVTTATNDASLLEKNFCIVDFVAHSYNVVREVSMEERVGEQYPR